MSKRISLTDLEIEVLYKMVQKQIGDPPYEEFHKLISLDIFNKLYNKLENARFKEREDED